MTYKIHHDSMGDVKVPEGALYGAQTQRAIDNVKISTRTMPADFIACLAEIKRAAARANEKCGAVNAQTANAIFAAGGEVSAGQHFEHFPVGVFQTGSGTSTNMNMNEVLSQLASERSGLLVHPNDHVNCSQSSNDVIPSCIQVSATLALERQLEPALHGLVNALQERSGELHDTVKTGRTHLMDALPVTFGQELSTWAFQIQECRDRLASLQHRLRALPAGGSAVGTGVNVPNGFSEALVEALSEQLGSQFTVSENRFSRIAGQDTALECSSCLRALATVLIKINSDLRWMSCGPLAGLAEIRLKALQPGSSIMPGKVNPILPEASLMAATATIGNDATIAMAAGSGNFQLNVMLPLIADKLLESIELLTGAGSATASTVAGFEVNYERVESTLSRNPILVTALNARIGYDAAAAIAKRAYAEQRPIIDVAQEQTDIPRDELVSLLDPAQLARPRYGPPR